MDCPKCNSRLVRSNVGYDEGDETMEYSRFFCFGCETLYEEYSQSGDYIEEYLHELGEIEYS